MLHRQIILLRKEAEDFKQKMKISLFQWLLNERAWGAKVPAMKEAASSFSGQGSEHR
jgi:hypothetical protein